MAHAVSENDKIREWFIYRITSPSGRVYIGKTLNFKARIRSYRHDGTTSKQPAVYKSFRKYGFDNHKIDIIDQFHGNNSDCNSREMFWIRTYMSNVIRYPNQRGLNLTDGGGGTLGYKKSDKERAAMVLRYTGRKQSDEQKRKNSELHKGNKYCLGRKTPQSVRDKMSAIAKGRKMTDLCLMKSREAHIKGVLVYDLNGIILHSFESLENCASFFTSTPETIRYIIKGKTKRPNFKLRGLSFKYKPDEPFNKFQFQRRIFNIKQAV